jgi:glyoxylase-like metal-dependent hydrolase (beta-lactamase superfamily II)
VIAAGGFDVEPLRYGAVELQPEHLGPAGAFPGPVQTPVYGFLLRGHGQTVLVDVGSGPFDPWWEGAAGLDDALAAAGVARSDVTRIVLTHLDFDHAGGLPDFPEAKVHVHANEKDAALARATFNQKQRYRSLQFVHGPAWETYEALGDPWKGVPAVRQLEGLPPEILALPMPGHSRGHAAIAVDTGHGWLVHGGDAYFHRSVAERGDASGMPWALRGIERFIAFDNKSVRANHAAFAELAKHDDVTIFSSHDPVEYERLRAASGT